MFVLCLIVGCLFCLDLLAVLFSLGDLVWYAMLLFCVYCVGFLLFGLWFWLVCVVDGYTVRIRGVMALMRCCYFT